MDLHPLEPHLRVFELVVDKAQFTVLEIEQVELLGGILGEVSFYELESSLALGVVEELEVDRYLDGFDDQPQFPLGLRLDAPRGFVLPELVEELLQHFLSGLPNVSGCLLGLIECLFREEHQCLQAIHEPLLPLFHLLQILQPITQDIQVMTESMHLLLIP